MEKKISDFTLAFHDVENFILENNLYGVDINEESVEIAQLALWLRTAKPHRKLNSLNASAAAAILLYEAVRQRL